MVFLLQLIQRHLVVKGKWSTLNFYRALANLCPTIVVAQWILVGDATRPKSKYHLTKVSQRPHQRGIHPLLLSLEAHSSKLANLWFRRRKRLITANSISSSIRPIRTFPCLKFPFSCNIQVAYIPNQPTPTDHRLFQTLGIVVSEQRRPKKHSLGGKNMK